MEDDDFERQQGRVGKVLAELGLTIKRGSLPALTKKVFAAGAPLTASELSIEVRAAQPEFDAAAAKAIPRNASAEQLLDIANEEAARKAAATAPKVEQKKVLDAKERAWIAKFPDKKLDVANAGNLRPITPPETNDE